MIAITVSGFVEYQVFYKKDSEAMKFLKEIKWIKKRKIEALVDYDAKRGNPRSLQRKIIADKFPLKIEIKKSP